jgi:hypothetical protein
MLQKLTFNEGMKREILIEKDEETDIFTLYFEGNRVARFLELAEGIYQTTSLNPNHLIDVISDFKNNYETEYEPIVDEGRGENWRYIKSYGVCDNYEQVLSYIPELKTKENHYVVFLTSMKKKHQPPRDGWRWEKWGEYIGVQDSQADYLYDEPVIEEVFVYHVCEVIPK